MAEERDSNSAPDPLLMGEIVPRLWIGNLQSLRELARVPLLVGTELTVVSVLKSEKLLQFARVAVQESSACIRSHLEWELQDDARAVFVSSKLEDILRAMKVFLQTMMIQTALAAIEPALCSALLASRDRPLSALHG